VGRPGGFRANPTQEIRFAGEVTPTTTPDDSYATDPDIPPPPVLAPERAQTESDARMWAAFAHLAGLLVLVGAPVIGCLVIWLWKRDTSVLVDEHGKEAVNFQISVLLFSAASVVLVVLTCGIGGLLVVPLAALMSVLVIVLPIIATVQASEGRHYRYPLTLRLID
jgi:uncharacterized Tic20 family protein